jgi:signal peptidase II
VTSDRRRSRYCGRGAGRWAETRVAVVPAIGFGLLIGGGVANIVDRLSATPHQVTDFIALGSFPVFNLADVAITAGFITLLAAALTGEKLLA